MDLEMQLAMIPIIIDENILLIKISGLIFAVAVFIYLFVLVFRKVVKPLIEELRNPSREMLDFANQANLDGFQKKALLSPYKQTLVIAGAGAGKTAILTKRIILFIKYLKIPITKMLVMAFNKDAAKEVAERVAKATGDKPESLKNNIRTIHSFALAITLEEKPKLQLFKGDKDRKNFIRQALKEEKLDINNTAFVGKVINLFGDMQPGENKLYHKDKSIPEPGKTIRCTDGTMVRSNAERRIVNKLVENGIKFEYEQMVGWADSYFEPDFFFPDYGLYAEYWGMMHHENENIRENYRKQMDWKKQQFSKYGFSLLDLYPKMSEKAPEPEAYLIAELKKLRGGQFVLAYKKKIATLFNSIEDQLIDLLITAAELVMAYGKKLGDLFPKADLYMKAVLAFIIPISEILQIKMDLKNKTTFTGMLNLAVNRLEDDKTLRAGLREKYKCIFVDEVQDLQPLTRRFIRQLTGKKQNLFAIGDDYQSIYSFAGSDPLFIVKFEHYFPQAKVLELKYNYRCHPNIVTVSNVIIKNNKHQRFKKVEGIFAEGQTENDKVLTLVTLIENYQNKQALAEYLLSQIPEKESVQFMARYSEGMPPIEPFMRTINEQFKSRNFKFLTIHKSKGLQSDNVVLLGCVDNADGKYCFPAKDNFHRIKDKILRLCRGDKFNLTEEETRLFYVAVTRAKKRAFVVTVKGQESEFIKENFIPGHLVNTKIISHFQA